MKILIAGCNGHVGKEIVKKAVEQRIDARCFDLNTMDVSGLDIGDSIYIRDIEIPEGIKSAQEDHLTIAVVVAPTVTPEEEVEEIEEVEETEDQKVEEEGEDKETQSG